MLNRRDLLLAGAALLGSGGTAAAEDAAAAANVLRLRPLGGGSGPMPVRIGRPFAAGEIARAPQAVRAGARVPTQADVKTRWPDGSVQHAVLSFVLPPLSGTATIGFADQPDAPGTPLTAAEMLDPAYDFDAVLAIALDGAVEQVSARAMLQAGTYTVWAAGPIATTIILADHSAARRWDMGGAPLRPLRPIFHATFWPARKHVQVRVIAEIANTEALTDLRYDLLLSAGAAAPREVLRQAGLAHYAAARWTHRFWTGGSPRFLVIDHNLPALIQTRAVPRYDTGISVSERALSRDWTRWQASQRGFFGTGLWDKFMPQTGGRDDIGPYPGLVARWLYSGDARLAEIVSGQADLAAAWPLHVREGNPAKRFDAAQTVPALGRPASIYARPTLWLMDDRDHSTAQDRVPIHGPRILTNTYPKTNGGWKNDGAHQPDPFSALYTVTGDYFALEQVQFWAAVQALSYDPAYKGPPPSGVIRDQVRGDAWVFRNRVNAAFLSPDGTPEKAYFTAIVNDALAWWEGLHGITGTANEGSKLWRFGRSTPFEPPLHLFAEQKFDGPGAITGGGMVPGQVSSDAALWQHYMLIFELGRAKEKGFPTGRLLDYVGQVLTGQFRDPAAYAPENLGRYWTPVRDEAGRFFPTWAATLPAYSKADPVIRRDVSDGYVAMACAAATMLSGSPEGQVAYAWLRKNFYDPLRDRYSENPKWAFLPRS